MKRILLMMTLLAIPLFCGYAHGADKIVGAWKGEQGWIHPAFILTSDRLITGPGTENEVKVIFENIADKINVKNAAHNNIVLIATAIQKDSAVFEFEMLGKHKYVRASENEVREMMEARPQRFTSKPDPF